MKLSKVAVAVAVLLTLSIPIDAFSQTIFFPNWSIEESQPNLKQGGRTNAVAINPFNSREMLAASDSGGLFKSIDGGERWAHVPTLPAIFTQGIAYVPALEDVVFVTTKADWKASNHGGVWRSGDGGDTWTQVELNPGSQFPDRISGFGISAVGDDVVVGTSEGLFVSSNGGATWEHSSPFPAGNRGVFSVLLTPGTSGGPARIYAGGPAGVRINTLPLGAWTSPGDIDGEEIWGIHAFGASARSIDSAYLAVETRLYRTSDRGTTWRLVATAQEQRCAGTPFVKTALRARGMLDVYHGNTCRVRRITSDAFGFTTTQDLVAEHFPRDLALAGTQPVLLASNGGLHNTTDGGAHWAYVGGGIAGYNALQVTDVKGQFVGDPGLFSLYFGTQDNNVWAVNVVGSPQRHDVSEGFFIDAEPQVDDPKDAKVTYVACGACRPRVASQWLANPRDVGHSPLDTAAPVLIRPGRRIQNVANGLDVTDDPELMTWQSFATFSEPPVGLPKPGFTGAGDDTIVYQAYRVSPTTVKLLRVAVSGGTANVSWPVMGGFGSVAVNRLMAKAWYPVFAVDHGNGNNIIAADSTFGRMSKSTDGGVTWNATPQTATAMTNLTNAVTNNGQLLFDASVPGFANRLPLVTAISHHPVNPSQMLLGTADGGIYYSSNRGDTWGKIAGSEPATYVTSFYWPTLNTVFVSTFGRGIWMLRNRPIAPPDAFDGLCGTCDVLSSDGTPGRPPFDNSVLIFDGNILGVRAEKGQLREVFVTHGSSFVFTGDPKDTQDGITITESDGKDTSQYEPLPRHPNGWLVTGVVFTSDDTLTGTVFSESELTLAPPEKE